MARTVKENPKYWCNLCPEGSRNHQFEPQAVVQKLCIHCDHNRDYHRVEYEHKGILRVERV